jgi:hypothetical protein
MTTRKIHKDIDAFTDVARSGLESLAEKLERYNNTGEMPEIDRAQAAVYVLFIRHLVGTGGLGARDLKALATREQEARAAVEYMVRTKLYGIRRKKAALTDASAATGYEEESLRKFDRRHRKYALEIYESLSSSVIEEPDEVSKLQRMLSTLEQERAAFGASGLSFYINCVTWDKKVESSPTHSS